MSSVLVVDDELRIQKLLSTDLTRVGYDVVTVGTGKDALHELQTKSPDAVVLDLRLPDVWGMDLLPQMRALAPDVPVIIITGVGDARSAIEAAQQGAFAYVQKPLELAALRKTLAEALAARDGEYLDQPCAYGAPKLPADGLVGDSPAMHRLYNEIGLAGLHNMPVLLLGETGTGKELAAQAISRHGSRADRPFVTLNCAAIPDNLLESELFGHEKGSFTGADRRHIGKFEKADGGTIFLDEVGELAPVSQAKLLRVLQDKVVERVGGDTVPIDVRIIAATNQDLEKLVNTGGFREDLYFRLAACVIRLPSLRERAGDVHLLVEHFLQTYSHAANRHIPHVDPQVTEILEAHGWRGNVRELQNVLQHAVAHTRGDTILVAALPDFVLRSEPAPVEVLDIDTLVRSLLLAGNNNIMAVVRRHFERHVLDMVLNYTAGNQRAAARRLGLSRTTLRDKLQALKSERVS